MALVSSFRASDRSVVGSLGSLTRWAAGSSPSAASRVESTIPNGLNIPRVVEHLQEGNGVVGFPGADEVNNTDLLELDCDVLVPAAIESVIHQGNAPRIRAAVVVEAANHPVTPEGDAILNDRGIHVLPDILVNAGGVVGSYFEWTQNLYQHKWDEDEVSEELHKIMSSAYRDVWEIVQREQVTFREAAFLLGVGRVHHAAKLRGFV